MSRLGETTGGRAQVMYQGAVQNVTEIGSGAAKSSAAVGNKTTVVELLADAEVFYLIGGTAATTSNASRLLADTYVHRGIQPGQTISFIAASGTANVNITEGA